MNIPTVRMKPNSASPLKLEKANDAVAVAAVTMHKTTLNPVVSKLRSTASSSVTSFSTPALAHSCGTRLKKCTTWSSPSPARIAIKDRLIRFTSPG